MADPKVPSKLGSMSHTFQKAWYKKNKMELPAHLQRASSTGKVDTTRTKTMQHKSLAAYGATKGQRIGSAEGTGETQRDTIKPLTRDQHSKIAAAKREAKKAEAPKRTTPLSHSERMSAIHSAVQKAKSPKRQARFDVPTLDKEHDDLRHDHDLMHSVGVKHSYNEAVDRMAMIKAITAKNKMNKPAALTKKPPTVKKAIDTHKHYAFFSDLDYAQKGKKQGQNRFEGFDPPPDEIAKMLIDKHGPNVTKSHIEDLEQDRDSHHALDHEAIMKSVKKLTQNEEHTHVVHVSYKSPGGNPFKGKVHVTADSHEDAKEKALKRMEGEKDVKVLSSHARNSNFPHEFKEETRQEAEKLLGGPVRAKSELPPAKNPMRNRARNLARQAMRGAVSAIHGSMEKTMQKENVTESTAEVNEMSHGKALAKMIMAKNKSMHPIAQHMGEAADDDREYGYEGDMVKSQCKSMIMNAQKLHDMLDDDTDLPEWVQLKVTLAQDYIATAADYMQGELDESVEIDEAHMTDAQMKRREHLVKSMKSADWEKRYPGRGEKVMYATATKMAMKEEVEQVDEKYMGFKAVMAAAKKGGARNPAAVAAAIGRKKYGKEKFQAMAAAGKRHANEEVEQTDEGYGGKFPKQWQKEMERVPSTSTVVDKDTTVVTTKKDGKVVDVKTTKNEATEGSVPTTPKEKELAAHHGDPNRITYGDVIKARLKAAAKKGN